MKISKKIGASLLLSITCTTFAQASVSLMHQSVALQNATANVNLEFDHQHVDAAKLREKLSENLLELEIKYGCSLHGNVKKDLEKNLSTYFKNDKINIKSVNLSATDCK